MAITWSLIIMKKPRCFRHIVLIWVALSIRQRGDRLVCPCHGSEYDLDGNVVKGPAWKNLEIIPSKITSDGTHIEING